MRAQRLPSAAASRLATSSSLAPSIAVRSARTSSIRTGESQPLIMGSYGIGVGRLLAAVLEQHNDEKGIIWPASIAPFQIHLVSLGTDKPEVVESAEALYTDLQAKGYDVLYDDRNESAGVKFNDADLIGIPLRLTVSARNIKNGVIEAKCRWADDRGERGRRCALPEDRRLAGLRPRASPSRIPTHWISQSPPHGGLFSYRGSCCCCTWKHRVAAPARCLPTVPISGPQCVEAMRRERSDISAYLCHLGLAQAWVSFGGDCADQLRLESCDVMPHTV